MRKSMISTLAIGMLAGIANADSVDLQFVERGLGWGHKVTIGEHTQNYVFTGQLMHAFSNGNGIAAGLNGRVLPTFCTDFFQHASSSGATYDVVDLATLPNTGSESPGMGAAKAQAIRNVLGYADTVKTFNSLGDEKNFNAALQFVIWEIVYEFDPQAGNNGLDSMDVETGYFSAVQTVEDRRLSRGIRRHFAGIRDNGVHFGSAARILALGSSSNQDQVVRLVPLPTAAGMGLASIGMIATRRRR